MQINNNQNNDFLNSVIAQNKSPKQLPQISRQNLIATEKLAKGNTSQVKLISGH